MASLAIFNPKARCFDIYKTQCFMSKTSTVCNSSTMRYRCICSCAIGVQCQLMSRNDDYYSAEMARWAVRVPARTYRRYSGQDATRRAEKVSEGQGVCLMEDSTRRQLRHLGERPLPSVFWASLPNSSSSSSSFLLIYT